MDKELKKKIEQGNKRLAIICSIMVAILAIPTLILSHKNPMIGFPIVIGYLITVILSMFTAPYIINKIWKQ